MLAILLEVERLLPDSASDLHFPGRKITFPIVLDDQWNRDALQRYMRTTRNSAVYLPSNIDYLARNNGLDGGAAEALQKLTDSPWVCVLHGHRTYFGTQTKRSSFLASDFISHVHSWFL